MLSRRIPAFGGFGDGVEIENAMQAFYGNWNRNRGKRKPLQKSSKRFFKKPQTTTNNTAVPGVKTRAASSRENNTLSTSNQQHVHRRSPVLKEGKRDLCDPLLRFKENHGFEAALLRERRTRKGNVENKVGYHRRNLLVPVPRFEDLEENNRELLRVSE